MENKEQQLDMDELQEVADQEKEAEKVEAYLEEMAEGGTVEVMPGDFTFYKFDVNKIETLEDVKKFIEEMGIVLTLPPGASIEDLGKTPEMWVEFDPEGVS